MYTENDYLTYTLLNEIEDKIEDLYDYYSMTYTPKTWVLNEYAYISNIKNIESAIDTMGAYFGYPSGWITSREWGTFGKISYVDINRWVSNIDLLRNSEFNPLVPSETLKPNEILKPTNKKESD